MRSNVSVHVDTIAHFLLAHFIKWHQVQSKLNIRPAWVCISIRLHISLVSNVFILPAFFFILTTGTLETTAKIILYFLSVD